MKSGSICSCSSEKKIGNIFGDCQAVIIVKNKNNEPSIDSKIHNIINKTGHCPTITNKTSDTRIIGFDDKKSCAKVAKYIDRLIPTINCQLISY